MKLIELLNKIANGEIKEGTKFKFVKYPQVYGVGIDYFVFGTANLNEEVEIIEEKQQGRWKPKVGERYWYISGEGVFLSIWHNHPVDNRCYLSKNVFKTEQEAKNCYAYKTALLEAEKPFEKNERNWFIKYYSDGKKMELGWNDDVIYQGMIYLGQDKDVAQAFVDKWYKQILKYEFGIGE